MVRRGRKRASLREDSGQALVEFALVVPVFLLLLFGIVEFARAWNIYEALTDAAREGARNVVVDNGMGDLEIKEIVVAAGQRARISIDPANIQVTGLNGGRGTLATVTISYEHEFRWVTIFWRAATGDSSVTMVSEFSMRNE